MQSPVSTNSINKLADCSDGASWTPCMPPWNRILFSPHVETEGPWLVRLPLEPRRVWLTTFDCEEARYGLLVQTPVYPSTEQVRALEQRAASYSILSQLPTRALDEVLEFLTEALEFYQSPRHEAPPLPEPKRSVVAIGETRVRPEFRIEE